MRAAEETDGVGSQLGSSAQRPEGNTGVSSRNAERLGKAGAGAGLGTGSRVAESVMRAAEETDGVGSQLGSSAQRPEGNTGASSRNAERLGKAGAGAGLDTGST